MTLLAILLILFVLIGYGLKEYYQVKMGPPTTTPAGVRDEIVNILNQLSPAGRIIDLGSGWGTLVLDLAKRLPDWQIDGLEASPTPWFIANCRSISSRLTNYRFFIGRMEQQALQNYDLLYINQPARNLTPMLPRFVRCLQSDAFIITYPAPLPRLPDYDVFTTAQNEKFYLYRGIDAVAFMNGPPTPSVIDTPPASVAPPAPALEPTADMASERPPTDKPPDTGDFPEQPAVQPAPLDAPAAETMPGDPSAGEPPAEEPFERDLFAEESAEPHAADAPAAPAPDDSEGDILPRNQTD